MSRRLGAYDVVFEADDRVVGFNLAQDANRPAVVRIEAGAASTAEQVRNADVPRSITNLDAGMGYSRRIEQVPNGYAYTLPGYTRSPGGIFSPPGKLTEISLPPTSGGGSWDPNNVIDSIRFGDFIYLIHGGPHVLRINAAGTAAEVVQTYSEPFGGEGAAVFNNRLYISGGGGTAYLDGATSTWSSVEASVRRYWNRTVNWRPNGIPTDVMVAASPDYGASAVRWVPITANPMVDGDWSAPVRVGQDNRFPINGIIAAPRHAYFVRPDGIYDMDELGARAFNIAPWVQEAADSHNGLWGTHIGTGLYYSHTQGLAFVPTTGDAQYFPDWAQPGWGLPYEGEVRGLATAGTLHDNWMLVGFAQDFYSYICAGRRDPQGSGGGLSYGQASHVWHGAEAVVPDSVTHMKVHTLSAVNDWPRLLIVTSNRGTPPVIKAYWQSLTRIGSPLQELLWGGHFEPADYAQLFLPADPWGSPSAIKTLLQVEMATENLDPTSDYLKVAAAAEDEASFTELGRADGGHYTSMAPLPPTEGRYIRTRIEAVGNPVLRSLELRAALGIQLREARVYNLVLAWDNALKGARSRETADPERRMLDLRALLGKVVMLDDGEVGGPMRVRVLQVMAGQRRRLGGAPRAGSNGAEGAWAIVVPVLVSILDAPFRWDGPSSVDRFDADRTWA